MVSSLPILSNTLVGLTIGGAPAPGAGAIAATHHPLAVDVGDDGAVASHQRAGRAHLGAQRQLALGKPVGAVAVVLDHGHVLFRTAGAEGAFVHLAPPAEVGRLRVLRSAEGAGVEAIAAADAQLLGM